MNYHCFCKVVNHLIDLGQTFPLRIRDSTLQFSMIRSLLDGNHNTFGAVHMPAERYVYLYSMI